MLTSTRTTCSRPPCDEQDEMSLNPQTRMISAGMETLRSGRKDDSSKYPCHTQRSRSFVPRRCDRIGSSRRLTARGARTLHWCNELATLLRGDSAAIAKPGATQLPRCGTFSTIVFPLSILCQPRREATFRGWKTEVLVFCMSERPVIFHTHTHIHTS